MQGRAHKSCRTPAVRLQCPQPQNILPFSVQATDILYTFLYPARFPLSPPARPYLSVFLEANASQLTGPL